MKKNKKIAIFVALTLISVGFVVSLGAMAVMNFDFTKMNTLNFVTNTYQVDETFSGISVDGAECDVRFVVSGDNQCSVVCNEGDKIYHSVTVENNTLIIERHDERKWYEHLGLYWADMEIVIYLPQSEFETLYIENLSGDIVIPEGFSFEAAEIYSTSGNVSFQAAADNVLSVKTVSGEIYVNNAEPQNLNIKSTSGDIELSNINSQSITAYTTSGDIEFSNIKCQNITTNTTSGEIEFSKVIANEYINIKSVSGDVELNKCDAGSLWIKTVSGDVSGLLLTEKIFFTDTTSGDVKVPHSASGGKCEIITTSGDIKLDIE
ncbi:MAG: DUF4097 domain-containing protein [Lachnospiraceae bacterium]|nr:DUF4097 domain-containing protein [Lachnospiraceae bacterium]